MKKYLKILKKKKTQSIVNTYKFIFLFKYNNLDKGKIIFLKKLSIEYSFFFYRIRQGSLYRIFKGQNSLLLLFFNKEYSNNGLFKKLLKLKFLNLILIKNFYIFSKNKIDNIFLFNNFYYIVIKIINFLLILLFKKIFFKNIIFKFIFLKNIKISASIS